MSYQSKNEQELEAQLANQLQADASAFEKHIIQCCKATEWDLRKFLRKTLRLAGFSIIEDAYRSDRCGKDSRYESVHNMLAIRGESPRVCLVSHTDVCRDHGDRSYSDITHWMGGEIVRSTSVKKPAGPPKVDPIIKMIEQDGLVRRIIQDRSISVQTGGDDRLGVAIITWIALNTGYPMGLYFPTDEEIGLKSAAACEIQELKDFDLLVEVDRGQHKDQLVLKISGEVLCDYENGARLLEIAYDIGHPRSPVTGAGTDVYALKRRGFAKNAVNMTCGYWESFGSSEKEYIDVQDARETLKYVSEIVKDYYLKP